MKYLITDIWNVSLFILSVASNITGMLSHCVFLIFGVPEQPTNKIRIKPSTSDNDSLVFIFTPHDKIVIFRR